jgi:ArsR family transcriptional regulator, arsenate/arsenite/antimonite-responsive transcriptional repressor
MDDQKNIEALAEAFRALSDPNRLRIMELLRTASHPVCVNAIAQKIGISQSAVSQHLRILRQQSLVKVKKEGYYKHYTVNLNELTALRSLKESVLGSEFSF